MLRSVRRQRTPPDLAVRCCFAGATPIPRRHLIKPHMTPAPYHAVVSQAKFPVHHMANLRNVAESVTDHSTPIAASPGKYRAPRIAYRAAPNTPKTRNSQVSSMPPDSWGGVIQKMMRNLPPLMQNDGMIRGPEPGASLPAVLNRVWPPSAQHHCPAS